MTARWLICALSLTLVGCGEANPPPVPSNDWIAPLAIDDVVLFVPTAWNGKRPSDPRPWPNGLRVDTGGWGQFEPWLGPLQHAGDYSPPLRGRPFRADVNAQPPGPDYPDPFFRLIATFEFPAPPERKTWWGGGGRPPVLPFRVDRLTYTYRAPADGVERPYVDLLAGLNPSDGEDIGSGWREVRRTFERRKIDLRFDAMDWGKHGGPLPRRLAASFGEPFWSHFELLDPPRWEAAFDTQRLPVDHWRARYETSEELFAWLGTPPDDRDADRRFVWWTDLRFRPTR